MKKLLIIALTILLIPSFAQAALVGVEVGQTVKHNKHRQAATPVAVYVKTDTPLFVMPRLEYDEGFRPSVSFGGKLESHGFFVEGSIGLLYQIDIKHMTSGHEQFILMAGVGYKRFVLRGYHTSDGAGLGIGANPNVGVNGMYIAYEW